MKKRSKDKKKFSQKLALSLILFFAFAIRIWGINSPTYSDEHFLMHKVAQMIEKGDLNPHWFSWPSAYFYVLTFVYKLLEWFIPAPIFYSLDFHRVARMVTALFGTATVFLTYKIAEEVFNKRIAIFAALVFSTLFIHVVDSHYATLDVPMAFLTAVAFLLTLKIIRRGTTRDYLLSGFFIGLANSFKYNFFLVLILPVAHLIKHWGAIKKKRLKVLVTRSLLLAFLALLGGFILGTPYSVLDYKTFIFGAPNAPEPEGLLAIISYVSSVRAVFASNLDGIPSWLWWLEYLFFSGLYYPIFLATILGGVFLTFQLNKEKSLVAFWLLLFLFTASLLKVRFDRYILPVTPFMAILSALAVVYLLNLTNKMERIFKILGNFLIIAFFLGLPIFRVIVFDYSISQKDTRQLAAEWIEKKYPKDQIVFAIGDTIHIGHYLQKEGFSNVMNLFPFDTKEIFQYPGEILLIDSATYHIAQNYKNIEEYKNLWENYQLVKEKGKLIKEFSQPLFKAEFFSPAFLEISSTVNAYHNPTVEIYEIPKLDVFVNKQIDFEYLPEKMSHNMQLLEKNGEKFLFKESENQKIITGPHKLFPKGDYLLDYFILSPRCYLQDAIVTLQVNPSGQTRYFAQNKFPCTSLGEYDKLRLRFRLEKPTRLELILEAKEGISFFIEKALLKRTNYD